MSLTFTALAEHNYQMSAMSASPYPSPPPSPKEDDDTSSECSYYSLPELENDRWYRNIPASQIREQAKQVPSLPAPAHTLYPRKFYNKEQLDLKSCGPWKEYPFCLNKRYVNGSPGPVRIIVNSAKQDDFDVVYHPEKDVNRVCIAKYRPKGYAKAACLKPSPHNPLPAGNTFGVAEGTVLPGVPQYYYPSVQPMSAAMNFQVQTAMFYAPYGVYSPTNNWGQYVAGQPTFSYTNQYPAGVYC